MSPEDADGTELVLEPDGHPAARPFKKALVTDGIPFTSFAVDDTNAEFKRLRALGVRFTQEPMEAGPVTIAVFDDTCGNLIQIASMKKGAAAGASAARGVRRPRESGSGSRGSTSSRARRVFDRVATEMVERVVAAAS